MAELQDGGGFLGQGWAFPPRFEARTGGAVRRNRIKRLVRETFRLHRDIFPSSSDIVFAVRPEFTLDGLNEVRAAVAELTGLPERHDVAAA